MTVQPTMDERAERQRGEALWWAGALIWAGLIFAADIQGWLPEVGSASAWSWVFAGAGLYALLLNLLALAMPSRPTPRTWDFLWAGILLVLGIGGFVNLEIAFPIILVMIGLAILASTAARR